MKKNPTKSGVKSKKPFKPMELATWLEIPIYGCHVGIVMTNQMVKSLDKHYNWPENDPAARHEKAVATTCKAGRDSIIFFNMRYRLDHGTIAHEVFHCVTNVMLDCGIPFTWDGDEVYAYLIQWLTDEVYKRINSWGLKIS